MCFLFHSLTFVLALFLSFIDQLSFFLMTSLWYHLHIMYIISMWYPTREKLLQKTRENLTTELSCPPVWRLSSCMGALSRELWQCTADTEVTCTVGTATHVLGTSLDVSFRVNQFCARAPGLWTEHFVTGGFLKGLREGKQRQVIMLLLITTWLLQNWMINSQSLCKNPAHSQPPLIHLPLQTDPHNHH